MDEFKKLQDLMKDLFKVEVETAEQVVAIIISLGELADNVPQDSIGQLS